MEEWWQTFQELIEEEKPQHRWTLTLDRNITPDLLQPNWKQYQQQVFARFQCSWCSRRWVSTKVQVLFHMRWNKRKSKGQVKMRIFGQRCQICTPPSFEVPEFTEKNISRILDKLVSKILKECYGEGEEDYGEGEEYYGEGEEDYGEECKSIPSIKDYPYKGVHDSDNCEACLLGFCARSGFDLATPSRTSSSSFSTSLPVEISSNEPCPTTGSTTEDSVTGNTQMEKGEDLQKPRFSEPTQVASPRANTNHQGQSIIQIPTLGEDLCSHTARKPTLRNVVICCSVIILILVIVLVVVIVVKFTN